MYPFPDYYAQFGIILKNTPYASLRYAIHEEVICMIIFLVLLGIEILISIVQLFKDCIREKRNSMKILYEQQIDTSSISTTTHSTID